MRDVNKVILIGRLGADPVQRHTKAGTSVVHFSLATSRRFLKEEGSSTQDPVYGEETQWHQVVVWGKQGENCAQYLKKGRAIYLEGSIRGRTYEDKNKVTKYSVEIVADSISFLDSPKSAPQEAPTPEPIAVAVAEADEIPF